MWGAYASMAKILIKNGRVWDGARFFHADVLTEGEWIAKIEPNIADSAETVYDAFGKTVSVGLVDAHVHMRGISIDKFGTQAELGCFPFGVTAAADASAEQGDGALLSSFLVKNVAFAKVDFKNNRADFTKTEEALRRLGERAVGVKVYFDTNISEVRDTAPLRQACDFAHQRGLLVMVHSSHAPVPMKELLEVLHKGDILTHAFHGGENSAAEDDFQSLFEAKARGVVIDAGFAGHIHTDFDVFFRAIEKGFIPELISTDLTKRSAYTRGGRYGMTLCMSLAKHAGMREENIFSAVTSHPAKALGKSDEWGTLAVGRRADLTVLEYSDEGFQYTDKVGHHVESREGYRCLLTVADGQIVYKH